MTRPRVALLPGSGTEPIACARRALEAVADLEFVAAASADAVLAERPLPALARELGHRAGLLAVRPVRALLAASPLREERIARTDLLIVHGREPECVLRLAFDAAERRRGRLAAVDGDWRGTVDRLAGAHPDVAVEPLDDAAAALIAGPARFDVIACDAPLGGVAAALTGLPPMLPGASLGGRGPGIFAPAAPGSSGSGTANPLPAVLAAALLLREGLGMEAEAERLEVAVEAALETGLRTPDLLLGAVGERRAGTAALAGAVLSALREQG